ncbi:hypothetical protein GGG16DRAFT_100286 [Schizophyllum commune]
MFRAVRTAGTATTTRAATAMSTAAVTRTAAVTVKTEAAAGAATAAAMIAKEAVTAATAAATTAATAAAKVVTRSTTFAVAGAIRSGVGTGGRARGAKTSYSGLESQNLMFSNRVYAQKQAPSWSFSILLGSKRIAQKVVEHSGAFSSRVEGPITPTLLLPTAAGTPIVVMGTKGRVAQAPSAQGVVHGMNLAGRSSSHETVPPNAHNVAARIGKTYL